MDGWLNRKSSPPEKKHREQGGGWLAHCAVAGECQPSAVELAECDPSGKLPDTSAGF